MISEAPSIIAFISMSLTIIVIGGLLIGALIRVWQLIISRMK